MKIKELKYILEKFDKGVEISYKNNQRSYSLSNLDLNFIKNNGKIKEIEIDVRCG